MRKHALIMYPHSNASSVLATGVLREGMNVHLFAPEEIHRRMFYTLPVDLQIMNSGSSNVVDVHTDLKDLKDMDFVVIPSLDVCTEKSREEYAKLCENTFR